METKFPNVERSAPGDIILEEVIISGSGNNTRIIANAVAQKPSQLSHEILSLLSKRETQEQRLTSDQHAGESRDATIDVHAEDDEHNLEKLKHVVAKYEPQKITSGIAKRKVVVAPIDIYDTRVINDGKAAESTTTESTTDLDNTYHEVLRNVSHEIPQLTMNNAGITLSPYPSQEMKNLKQIPTLEATIRTLTDDGTEQPSHSNIDPSYALSALKKKKLLLKKYTQPSYTITASPRASSDEESRLDESTADINESTISKEHSHVVNGNPKLRNEPSTLSSLNVSLDPTGESGNHREWNVEDPSSQIPLSPKSPTVLQSSNHVLNADNLNKKQPSLQTVFNSLHLPLKYNKVPRPFSISVIDPPQLPNAATNIKNVATAYKKPSSSLTDVTHQIVHPASTVLPFVLPTEQFSTPLARHYVPIKRGNHDFKSNGIYTTATTFNAKSPGEGIAVSQKPAPYANAIDTTKIPVVAVNGHQSPNYYFVTENPMEQKTVATSFATTYIPSQPPVTRILQRRKEPQDVAHNTEFVSRVASSDDKTNLNANPAIALYNKFAGLYSIPTTDVPNVLHASQAIAQDYENFKQPSLLAQQASALPYKTRGAISLKPIPPALLKPRPIASAKPLAPYFDYSLLLPQQPGAGKLIGEGGEKIVGKSEPSRVGDKIEGDTANDKSTLGNYQTQINHGAYKIHEDVRATPNAHEIHETPSKRKQSHNEDPYYQRSRDDEREDEYRRRQDKNDGEDGGSKNVRNENDEEDAGETRDDEHKTRENKDKNDDNYHRYDKFKYDRDNSEGEQRKQQHNGAERYDGEERPRDKYDRDIGVNHELTDGLRYDENDEEYRSDRYEQQKSARDGRYGEKSRRDREKEEHEDDSATELVAGRAEDQRAREQHGKYQKIRNNNGDKRIYYSHLTSPTDSLRQAQQKDEEYGEIKPKHVHEEYQQQKRVKDDYRDLKQEDNGSKGHGNEQEHGETQDHAHKEHHDEKKHGEDHKFEAGDGGEHEEEHHKHEGEKGDKGYKVWHEDEKAAKGHHDKEHSNKEYDEKVGEEKKHNEESGYHEDHNHDEKGEKTAEFGEKGEHKKGHSTKGEHSVHKKDEYEKKTVFFDEFHDDGEMEKHGEHHLEHKLEKGGHEKKAHHDIVDHEEKHGKQQKYEKGSHHHEDDGHKVHEGHDHHYDHDHKYGEKGGHEHGKKWSFKKGDDGGHKHNR
ncbi:uncharacterized protein LOC116847202 [Odontomachus brunneus]|uniref:uncharacterized protein LOC116847202 n=1 Tax=Odontomachus brunneus TaxID=486640 RepID=UPI0013F1EE62|nr:uncharacterized protein LOC116847202 [Odontomachus brunneus]